MIHESTNLHRLPITRIFNGEGNLFAKAVKCATGIKEQWPWMDKGVSSSN